MRLPKVNNAKKKFSDIVKSLLQLFLFFLKKSFTSPVPHLEEEPHEIGAHWQHDGEGGEQSDDEVDGVDP